MDELSYNEYYRSALNEAQIGEDYQHYVFELLKREGYIIYERKAISRFTK